LRDEQQRNCDHEHPVFPDQDSAGGEPALHGGAEHRTSNPPAAAIASTTPTSAEETP
jgi:hypothetical protein